MRRRVRSRAMRTRGYRGRDGRAAERPRLAERLTTARPPVPKEWCADATDLRPPVDRDHLPIAARQPRG